MTTWGIISTADINRLVIPPAQESSAIDLVGVVINMGVEILDRRFAHLITLT